MGPDERMYEAAITVDGEDLTLLLAGASEQHVRALLRAHWADGQLHRYQLTDGRELFLRWSKVGTTTPLTIRPVRDDTA